jgi:predicted aldo/keto reductase-like oxidoreductase
LYEHTLKTREVRGIAMQVLSGGATPVKQALQYVCNLPKVESILFGASSRGNIHETVSLIRQFDSEKK